MSAILDAAIRLLRERPQATMEEIAAAAGLSRQTVYAHFPSREALVAAVLQRLTDDAVAAMDAANLDEGPAPAALLRLLDAGWRTVQRFPLLEAGAGPADPELHGPVFDRLAHLIHRGQQVGEFDPEASPGWLMAATIALGHAAADEVTAGRMSADDAATALRASILRVYGARPSTR